MTTVVNEQDVATALLTAINATLAPRKAWDDDKVPADADKLGYVTINLSRRYVDDRLVSGEVTMTGWRLVTRYVSKSVPNARLMRAKVATALEEALVPFAGDYFGPVDFESAEPIGPDDGWFSGADTWTF